MSIWVGKIFYFLIIKKIFNFQLKTDYCALWCTLHLSDICLKKNKQKTTFINIFTQSVWAVISYSTRYTMLELMPSIYPAITIDDFFLIYIECTIAPLPPKGRTFTGYTSLQQEPILSSKSTHFNRGNLNLFLLPKHRSWGRFVFIFCKMISCSLSNTFHC